MRITGGRGVDVVYDSVGQDTVDGSLNCLRTRGMLVVFGQSSGPIPPIDTGTLNRKGSLFLTRTGLGHHLLTRENYCGAQGTSSTGSPPGRSRRGLAPHIRFPRLQRPTAISKAGERSEN